MAKRSLDTGLQFTIQKCATQSNLNAFICTHTTGCNKDSICSSQMRKRERERKRVKQGTMSNYLPKLSPHSVDDINCNTVIPNRKRPIAFIFTSLISHTTIYYTREHRFFPHAFLWLLNLLSRYLLRAFEAGSSLNICLSFYQFLFSSGFFESFD